jgi:hypothetical protein
MKPVTSTAVRWRSPCSKLTIRVARTPKLPLAWTGAISTVLKDVECIFNPTGEFMALLGSTIAASPLRRRHGQRPQFGVSGFFAFEYVVATSTFTQVKWS